MRACLAVSGLASMSMLLATVGARDAAACGGTFVPPTVDEAVTTDHRMILSVSQQQTTLWDEIQFTGSPSSFAWVLPIKGTATVGLSADILFGTLDTLTAPQVQEPALNCPPSPCEEELGAARAGGVGECAGGACGTPNNNGGGVTVLSNTVVGPFETVQLSSTSPTALNDWLTSHGFAIPTDAAAVITEYVQGGFNFLAMKLAPGEGVSTMRPVRVTTAGASATLPLRMVAVGTGATTGITLWVVGDGRYEPQNFPFFTLTDSEIVWDWTTSTSNYDALRTSLEATFGGKGWQIESSLELAQLTVTDQVMAPSFNPDAGVQTVSTEYSPVDAGGGVDAGAQAAFEDDLTTLFSGIAGPNARITRMRSDIAHAALSADLTLQASSDQGELTNIYLPGSTTGTPPVCPVNTCGGATPVSAGSAGGASGAGASSGGGASGAGAGKVVSAGGGGCTASRSDDVSWGSWGLVAGFIGFGVSRSRRRRGRAT